MLQKVKDYLVGLGPDNRLTQLALSMHARSVGFSVNFSDPTRIWIEKDNRRLALARRDLTFVPIMMEVYDVMFDSIVPAMVNGRETLDFSQPAFQVYKRSGMGFFFHRSQKKTPSVSTPIGTRLSRGMLCGMQELIRGRQPAFCLC